jgi:AcrR family transcriptional regulator
VSKRAELHDAIVRASLEIGSEFGEEGLTMRGIAARLGVSATALYQHFESKNQILREIRVFGVLQLWEAMKPALQEAEPGSVLRGMIVRYVEFASENPWLYNVLMEQEELDWTRLDPSDAEWAIRPLLELRKVLESGREAGVFADNLDVVTASLQVWAAVHGLSSLLIAGRIDEKHPMFPVPDKSALVSDFAGALLASIPT